MVTNHLLSGMILQVHPKKTPTYPWNIPQILDHLFMKEMLSKFVVWGTGGMFQGSVGIFWDASNQQQEKDEMSKRFSKRIPTWWQDGGGTNFAAPFSFAWQTGSCCLARGHRYRQPTGSAGTRGPHVLWKDAPASPWQNGTCQTDIV